MVIYRIKNIRYIEELNMDRVSPQNTHFETRSSLKNKCMEGCTSCLKVLEQVTNACLQREEDTEAVLRKVCAGASKWGPEWRSQEN